MAIEKMSIESYANKIGKSRVTVHRWAVNKLAGKKSLMPKNVKVTKVIGRMVLEVKEEKKD